MRYIYDTSMEEHTVQHYSWRILICKYIPILGTQDCIPLRLIACNSFDIHRFRIEKIFRLVQNTSAKLLKNWFIVVIETKRKMFNSRFFCTYDKMMVQHKHP